MFSAMEKKIAIHLIPIIISVLDVLAAAFAAVHLPRSALSSTVRAANNLGSGITDAAAGIARALSQWRQQALRCRAVAEGVTRVGVRMDGTLKEDSPIALTSQHPTMLLPLALHVLCAASGRQHQQAQNSAYTNTGAASAASSSSSRSGGASAEEAKPSFLEKLRAIAFFCWSLLLSIPLFVTMLTMAPFVMLMDKYNMQCMQLAPLKQYEQ
eukprot:1158715-Pelagomonas_calceolata.AAC.7